MPKRTDIQPILITDAGPIIIGQACGFDHKGPQAVRFPKDRSNPYRNAGNASRFAWQLHSRRLKPALQSGHREFLRAARHDGALQ